MDYVKFETPDDLKDNIKEALEVSQDTGKIKKGTNEVTKAVERGNAKLVIIGSDVEPPEIVMHLPMLGDEKDIPYAYLTKEEIGKAVGIPVPSASACIVKEGKAEELVTEITDKIKEIKS